jgi:hypothetical protein
MVAVQLTVSMLKKNCLTCIGLLTISQIQTWAMKLCVPPFRLAERFEVGYHINFLYYNRCQTMQSAKVNTQHAVVT